MAINHDHHELFQRAYQAGMDAIHTCNPNPMIVRDPKTGREWLISDGACGFAWVKIAGNTAFARSMKSMGFFRKAWDRGLDFWVSEGNQSIARKEAFACAFAQVLNDNGIKASVGSRLD